MQNAGIRMPNLPKENLFDIDGAFFYTGFI